MPFFLIFIAIPFIEIMVFMAVGEHIGILTTLMLAFITAIIGGAIVRHQGLQTLLAMKIAMDAGKIPLGEIFDGFCLVAAGALLITPGFVTDTLGFLLLVPPVRNTLKTLMKNHTSWTVETTGYTQGGTHIRDPGALDAEYERVEDGPETLEKPNEYKE